MDLISRQAALDALKMAEALTRAFGYHNVIETIRDLPTAEPRKGKWEVINEKEEFYSCSECGFVAWGKGEISNYCPNCGCRMTEN